MPARGLPAWGPSPEDAGLSGHCPEGRRVRAVCSGPESRPEDEGHLHLVWLPRGSRQDQTFKFPNPGRSSFHKMHAEQGLIGHSREREGGSGTRNATFKASPARSPLSGMQWSHLAPAPRPRTRQDILHRPPLLARPLHPSPPGPVAEPDAAASGSFEAVRDGTKLRPGPGARSWGEARHLDHTERHTATDHRRFCDHGHGLGSRGHGSQTFL